MMEMLGKCVSVAKNGPYWTICLNTWSPIGGTVLEGLEEMTLGSCVTGVELRGQKLTISK